MLPLHTPVLAVSVSMVCHLTFDNYNRPGLKESTPALKINNLWQTVWLTVFVTSSCSTEGKSDNNFSVFNTWCLGLSLFGSKEVLRFKNYPCCQHESVDLQLVSAEAQLNLAVDKQNRGNSVRSSSVASDSQTVTPVWSCGCSHNAGRLYSQDSATHTHTNSRFHLARCPVATTLRNLSDHKHIPSFNSCTHAHESWICILYTHGLITQSWQLTASSNPSAN